MSRKARKIENGVAKCHMVDITHGVSVIVSMTVIFWLIQVPASSETEGLKTKIEAVFLSLALFARVSLLCHALLISLLILMKKPTHDLRRSRTVTENEKKNEMCDAHARSFFASSTKWYFPKLLNIHARTVCSRLISVVS